MNCLTVKNYISVATFPTSEYFILAYTRILNNLNHVNVRIVTFVNLLETERLHTALTVKF